MRWIEIKLKENIMKKLFTRIYRNEDAYYHTREGRERNLSGLVAKGEYLNNLSPLLLIFSLKTY